MAKKWKIFKTDGGTKGQELHGCVLEEVSDGFEFRSPEKGKLTGKTGLTPTIPFTFPDFNYGKHDWRITVTSIGVGAQGKESTGLWKCDPVSPSDEEDGSWTAQAGSGEEVKGSAKSAKVK